MFKLRLFNPNKLFNSKSQFQGFSNSTILQRYSKLTVRKVVSYKSPLRPLSVTVIFTNSMQLSSCSYMNSKDKVDETLEDKNVQKALDDEDFQNILKDFAKDFGVGDEGNKILEDIKKNIDEEGAESCDKNEREKSAYDAVSREKYKDFEESDSSYIHSYEDLQAGEYDSSQMSYHVVQEYDTPRTYEQLKRGIQGVFDIAELVDVLRNERLSDIVVISVPKELHYTDFLVLATAKSPRHCTAATELINKLYKKKKSSKDPFIIIEGENASDWRVLDMGNIVLHVLLKETRDLYDIESLWLLDSTFDSGGNVKVDPMIDAIEEQLAFFNSLQNKDTPLSKDSS